jgi:predicted DNA-binding transcriptional regulator AlpA
VQIHPNRFLRLREILGDEDTPSVIPVSKSAWWAGVKTGRYPKPIKLSPRVTVWRASEIYALVQR